MKTRNNDFFEKTQGFHIDTGLKVTFEIFSVN